MATQKYISQSDAKAQGLSRFYTGVPCKWGHDAERYVDCGKCVLCVSRTNAKKHAKRLNSTPEQRAEEEERRRQRSEEKAERKARYKQASELRQEAKKKGYTTYYSPRPCRNGHAPGERYTKTGKCVQCATDELRRADRKEYDRKYYQENREYIRKRTREYVERTREQRAAAVKDWQRRNPEKARLIKLSYKARRRSQEAMGDSTADITAWEKRQKKVCYWCGKLCPKKYHIDHYRPLAKGGSHTTDNLVIACQSCNQHKSAKDPYEYAAVVGRLF